MKKITVRLAEMDVNSSIKAMDPTGKYSKWIIKMLNSDKEEAKWALGNVPRMKKAFALHSAIVNAGGFEKGDWPNRDDINSFDSIFDFEGYMGDYGPNYVRKYNL